MKFMKYHRYGAYHWRWYGKKKSYTDNVDYIKEWVKEKSVLDIGAGDGFVTNLLGINGVDNEPKAVEVAGLRGQKIKLGDAHDLPYRNNRFESALMNDVLEHLDYPDVALQEARRVITKYLYLNIPTKERFIEPYHLHGWSAEELENLVVGVGFELVEGPIIKSGNRTYFKFKKI